MVFYAFVRTRGAHIEKDSRSITFQKTVLPTDPLPTNGVLDDKNFAEVSGYISCLQSG